MEQILIIEDDISLNKGLCQALKSDDRQIFSCTSLKTACLLYGFAYTT